MKFLRNQHGKRRGAIVPLAALLMVVLVGMLAFAIDVGYMSTVKAELQNAADAAALAGAERLQNQFVQFYAPGQQQQTQIFQYTTTNKSDPNSPISTAQRFAGYNQAGGVYLQLPDSDVSFSYYDGAVAVSRSEWKRSDARRGPGNRSASYYRRSRGTSPAGTRLRERSEANCKDRWPMSA